MSGVRLQEGELIVERSANELDELAIAFSGVLSELGIEHVFIAGYLAILTGRARSTEDIDVLIERLSEDETTRLLEKLEERDYWGPAMPLAEMYETLSAGTNIWVAPTDQMTPHLEVKFPTDEFDRASLSNSNSRSPTNSTSGAGRTSRTRPTSILFFGKALGSLASNPGLRNSAYPISMPDSNPSEDLTATNPPEELAAKGEQNRQERIDGIKRWVQYIQEHPPDVWGSQQNRLVNSQLKSARETGLSPEHVRRVRAFGEAVSEAADDTG